MSLQYEIEELERKLAGLRKMSENGYEVKEVVNYGEYMVNNDHEVIRCVDGSLAGIVLNQKIMKKYFADEGETA